MCKSSAYHFIVSHLLAVCHAMQSHLSSSLLCARWPPMHFAYSPSWLPFSCNCCNFPAIAKMHSYVHNTDDDFLKHKPINDCSWKCIANNKWNRSMAIGKSCTSTWALFWTLRSCERSTSASSWTFSKLWRSSSSCCCRSLCQQYDTWLLSYRAVKYRHFRNDSLSISGAISARCTLAQL